MSRKCEDDSSTGRSGTQAGERLSAASKISGSPVLELRPEGDCDETWQQIGFQGALVAQTGRKKEDDASREKGARQKAKRKHEREKEENKNAANHPQTTPRRPITTTCAVDGDPTFFAMLLLVTTGSSP